MPYSKAYVCLFVFTHDTHAFLRLCICICSVVITCVVLCSIVFSCVVLCSLVFSCVLLCSLVYCWALLGSLVFFCVLLRVLVVLSGIKACRHLCVCCVFTSKTENCKYLLLHWMHPTSSFFEIRVNRNCTWHAYFWIGGKIPSTSNNQIMLPVLFQVWENIGRAFFLGAQSVVKPY